MRLVLLDITFSIFLATVLFMYYGKYFYVLQMFERKRLAENLFD